VPLAYLDCNTLMLYPYILNSVDKFVSIFKNEKVFLLNTDIHI
jgi:hypothetical protein